MIGHDPPEACVAEWHDGSDQGRGRGPLLERHGYRLLERLDLTGVYGDGERR